MPRNETDNEVIFVPHELSVERHVSDAVVFGNDHACGRVAATVLRPMVWNRKIHDVDFFLNVVEAFCFGGIDDDRFAWVVHGPAKGVDVFLW